MCSPELVSYFFPRENPRYRSLAGSRSPFPAETSGNFLLAPPLRPDFPRGSAIVNKSREWKAAPRQTSPLHSRDVHKHGDASAVDI